MLSQHSYSVGIQTHLKERDWLTLITFNVRIKRRKKQTLQSQETRRWSAGGIGEIIFSKLQSFSTFQHYFVFFQYTDEHSGKFLRVLAGY